MKKAPTAHGHSHDAGQMNMRGAFLHVLSDALGSVIVVISALVILFFFVYRDIICCVLQSAIFFFFRSYGKQNGNTDFTWIQFYQLF